MKVRAKRLGFFNHKRVKEGTIFTVSEEAFSESWMEKVEAPVSEAPKKKKSKPKKEDEFSSDSEVI
jgi:hypothetical protein